MIVGSKIGAVSYNKLNQRTSSEAGISTASATDARILP